MNANDEIMARYEKNREDMRQRQRAWQADLEERLRKSIEWQKHGIIKPYNAKGWRCTNCPEKQLKHAKDVETHLTSKAHAETVMLNRLAK